jgi:hypothetical protein
MVDFFEFALNDNSYFVRETKNFIYTNEMDFDPLFFLLSYYYAQLRFSFKIICGVFKNGC